MSQSEIAVGIKIRIWFVENKQRRPSKNGPCQSESLRLPTGKHQLSVAYDCVVSVRETQDNVVNPGQYRRGNDAFVVCVRPEPGNVLFC